MFRQSATKLAVIAAFVSVLGATSTAEAFVINWGEDITHVADIPPEADFPPGFAVGYKYSEFGVLWLNVWTWGGEFVVFEGESYKSLEDAGISTEEMAKIVGKDLKKPWQYSYPIGLFVILILGAGYLGFTVYTNKQEAKTRALMADERYQKAVAMVSGDGAGDGAGAGAGAVEGEAADASGGGEGGKTVEDAVAYLTDLGIPREEAEKNLHAIFTLMAEDEAAATDISL